LASKNRFIYFRNLNWGRKSCWCID